MCLTGVVEASSSPTQDSNVFFYRLKSGIDLNMTGGLRMDFVSVIFI